MIRVILADDNESALNTMAKILGSYKEIEIVAKAKDGEEELKYIIEKQPDIIVTDIEMPLMTGIDVIEKIQNMEKKPKVIVVSGATSSFVQSKVASLKVYQIFKKPIEYDRLANEIIEISKITEISNNVDNEAKQKLDKTRKQSKILNFFNKLKR